MTFINKVINAEEQTIIKILFLETFKIIKTTAIIQAINPMPFPPKYKAAIFIKNEANIISKKFKSSKHMPLLEDLYKVLEKDKRTKIKINLIFLYFRDIITIVQIFKREHMRRYEL